MDDILSYASWRKLDFSYHKFFSYLLSPEFIEKYYPYAKAYIEFKYFPIDAKHKEEIAKAFWEAIYEYQSWNSRPLIDLLSKI